MRPGRSVARGQGMGAFWLSWGWASAVGGFSGFPLGKAVALALIHAGGRNGLTLIFSSEAVWTRLGTQQAQAGLASGTVRALAGLISGIAGLVVGSLQWRGLRQQAAVWGRWWIGGVVGLFGLLGVDAGLNGYLVMAWLPGQVWVSLLPGIPLRWLRRRVVELPRSGSAGGRGALGSEFRVAGCAGIPITPPPNHPLQADWNPAPLVELLCLCSPRCLQVSLVWGSSGSSLIVRPQPVVAILP